MWLESPFGRVDLNRITPKAVVAKSPQTIPPCLADLIVMVDGARMQKRVNLPSGFRGGSAAMMRPAFEVAPF